jgi:hypothetical protein
MWISMNLEVGSNFCEFNHIVAGSGSRTGTGKRFFAVKIKMWLDHYKLQCEEYCMMATAAIGEIYESYTNNINSLFG